MKSCIYVQNVSLQQLGVGGGPNRLYISEHMTGKHELVGNSLDKEQIIELLYNNFLPNIVQVGL